MADGDVSFVLKSDESYFYGYCFGLGTLVHYSAASHANPIRALEIARIAPKTNTINLSTEACKDLAKYIHWLRAHSAVEDWVASTATSRWLRRISTPQARIWAAADMDASLSKIVETLYKDYPLQESAAASTAIQAPKNNDGREVCYWCGGDTKAVQGFAGNSVYNVCTRCGK